MSIFSMIFTQEVPSDVTVQANGVSFSLHKLPLVSKCGRVRKLVSEANDVNLSFIELVDVPGGAEAFELAANFCYGINFEINIENIAMLRCVAEYLEMTEEYVFGNLVNRTEAYLTEVALNKLSRAVTVLKLSENLLPIADEVKLVSRCIDAIVNFLHKESQFSSLEKVENNLDIENSFASKPKSSLDWWAEDLTVLKIDTFQRVLIAMNFHGLSQHALGPLMLYAHKSIRGLDLYGRNMKKLEPKEEHEKRVILETIVGLLPREKNAISVSFLSMLLRAAIYLETTVACRLDLEKRIGLQLGQAVLDDLLISSFSYVGDTIFDVDTIRRVFLNFLEQKTDFGHMGYNMEDSAYFPSSDMERVGRLMECYLAEIATDSNLTIAKFIGLVELIPEQARVTEDGIYRAIDIYLKAHSLSDLERKKVCSFMDCQKLSREACAHAAQNERLPVQTVVQVLYHEQQRLRDPMNVSPLGGDQSLLVPQKATSNASDHLSAVKELASLRRENEDLKLQLLKMHMRMKELEMTHTSSPSIDKPPLPRKTLINSVSKKLGKLNPFVRSDGARGRTKPGKDRRHSVS